MAQNPVDNENPQLEIATFGAGCFWCVEAIFQQVEGVKEVVSGYSGGFVDNPTYRDVCTGETGHAEVVQITFDKNVVPFRKLLEIFWGVHDPTTLNRQGGDVGTQYRSVVFYHSEEQLKLTKFYKEELDRSDLFEDPIVTEISPYKEFFSAEDYHQEYYDNNKNQPYCQTVIRPKLEKFRKIFIEK